MRRNDTAKLVLLIGIGILIAWFCWLRCSSSGRDWAGWRWGWVWLGSIANASNSGMASIDRSSYIFQCRMHFQTFNF
jgi:hypothetical protein